MKATLNAPWSSIFWTEFFRQLVCLFQSTLFWPFFFAHCICRTSLIMGLMNPHHRRGCHSSSSNSLKLQCRRFTQDSHCLPIHLVLQIRVLWTPITNLKTPFSRMLSPVPSVEVSSTIIWCREVNRQIMLCETTRIMVPKVGILIHLARMTLQWTCMLIAPIMILIAEIASMLGSLKISRCKQDTECWWRMKSFVLWVNELKRSPFLRRLMEMGMFLVTSILIGHFILSNSAARFIVSLTTKVSSSNICALWVRWFSLRLLFNIFLRWFCCMFGLSCTWQNIYEWTTQTMFTSFLNL